MRGLEGRTLLTVLTLLSHTAAQTIQGCYKDDGSLTSQGTYAYQSEGYCSQACSALGSAVFAMSNADECACGNALPSTSVASSLCNLACSGYPSDTCGGNGYYSVWLTGVGALQGSAAAASNAAGSSAATGTDTAANHKQASTTTTTTPPSAPTTATTVAPVAPSVIYITTAVVQQGVTVIQTVSAATPTAATSAAHASSSAAAANNKKTSSGSGGGGGLSGGAIAGIVIGVLAGLAVAAIIAFLLLRRRRTHDTEDFGGEYKKHIEPAGAGRTQTPSPDNRLDTSLAVRRNSSESFADNQDYSRKILRVIN